MGRFRPAQFSTAICKAVLPPWPASAFRTFRRGGLPAARRIGKILDRFIVGPSRTIKDTEGHFQNDSSLIRA